VDKKKKTNEKAVRSNEKRRLGIGRDLIGNINEVLHVNCCLVEK